AAPIPTLTAQIGLKALRAIQRERSVMAALPVMRNDPGDIFRINLPGFNPVVLSGPEACRWVLGEQRENLLWRIDTDPITQLLDPERFAPGTAIAPYSHLPFGGGTRSCIGANFAQIEARVLQRFDVSAQLTQRYIPRPSSHVPACR
ncbi:MAG: hypothetical protein DCC53_09845, partial [Chloroflexi bacterium]